MIIAKSNKFEAFIMGCIIINIIILGCSWYLDPLELEFILNIINNVFAGIFVLEAVIKISAFGKIYFNNGWNILDFTVLVGTFI
jgi:hypothetical protein